MSYFLKVCLVLKKLSRIIFQTKTYWSVWVIAKGNGNENSNAQHSIGFFNLLWSPAISTALVVTHHNKYLSCHVYYPWLRWIEISAFYNKEKKAKALYHAQIFDTVCSGFWEPEWRGSVPLQAQATSASLYLTLLLSWDQSWVLSPSEGNITRLWEGREKVKRLLTLPLHTPGGEWLWRHCCG